MPQFDFGNVFIPQLFWLAVFFVVLYFGIVRLTLPKLGRVIDEREGKIAADIAAAKVAKDEADATAEAYRQSIAQTRDGARESVAKAEAAAAAARAEQIARADAAANERIEAAEKRIAEARDAASASLREVAIDSTRDIVARLIGNEPDPAATTSAVDAAMARA